MSVLTYLAYSQLYPTSAVIDLVYSFGYSGLDATHPHLPRLSGVVWNSMIGKIDKGETLWEFLCVYSHLCHGDCLHSMYHHRVRPKFGVSAGESVHG
jgi:hypothetical protein